MKMRSDLPSSYQMGALYGASSNPPNDIRPMVAHRGTQMKGFHLTQRWCYIEDIGDVPIDIAYAGSCTAGKDDDFAFNMPKGCQTLELRLRWGGLLPQFGSKAVRVIGKRLV